MAAPSFEKAMKHFELMQFVESKKNVCADCAVINNVE
jgi:hypothetical protein